MFRGCVNTLQTEPLPADVERVAVDVCFAAGDGLGKDWCSAMNRAVVTDD